MIFDARPKIKVLTSRFKSWNHDQNLEIKTSVVHVLQSQEVQSPWVGHRAQRVPRVRLRSAWKRHNDKPRHFRTTKRLAVNLERESEGKAEIAAQENSDPEISLPAEPDSSLPADPESSLQDDAVDPAVFAYASEDMYEVKQPPLHARVGEAVVGAELQPIFSGGRLREAAVVDLLMEHAVAHNISQPGMQGFVDILNLLIVDGGAPDRVLKKWTSYDKAMIRAAASATSKYLVCPKECLTGCMPLQDGVPAFCSGCGCKITLRTKTDLDAYTLRHIDLGRQLQAIFMHPG